ncbi:MAG: hypothetical protein ABSC35_08550 [Candidatus Dormibacteria bacterium]
MALNPYESPRGRLRGRAEATRRQFLLIMGGLATAGASLFGGIEVLRFMFPVASSNAPALFKTSFSFLQLTGGVVGGKAVTPVNVITDTNHRVSVILDDAGIYAVLLICTHLGCTPNYVSDVVTGSGARKRSKSRTAGHAHVMAAAISSIRRTSTALHRARWTG